MSNQYLEINNNNSRYNEMLKLQESLICFDKNTFDRDSEIVLTMYKEILNLNKGIPEFSELEKFVLNYNYDLCFSISLLYFEEKHDKDIEFETEDEYKEIKYNYVSEAATNMMNDICWDASTLMRDLIKMSLIKKGVIFIDDDPFNPITSMPFFNFMDHKIIVNDAQQIMFPDLHLMNIPTNDFNRDFDRDFDILDFKVECKHDSHYITNRLGDGYCVKSEKILLQ